jgi:iron-sulfur cluster repair protein YtfE (RIC family)
MPLEQPQADSNAPMIQTEDVSSLTIRELTALVPETMAILAPLGIDLCCGGAHQLGTALELHGIDPDAIMPEIERLVAEASMNVPKGR